MGVQAGNMQQAMQIQLMERTRLYDRIFLKHGAKIIHLQHEVLHHNLDKDQEIMDATKSNKLS